MSQPESQQELKSRRSDVFQVERLPWKAFFAFALGYVISLAYIPKIVAYLAIAFVLAYLLDPIVTKLHKRGVPRSIGTLIAFFVAIFVCILLSLGILPVAYSQGHELIDRMPAAIQAAIDTLRPISVKILGYNVFENFDRLYTTLTTLGTSKEMMKPLAQIVEGVFTNSFRVIFAAFGLMLIPMLTFYFLSEFPHLYRVRIKKIVPAKYSKLSDEIRRRVNKVMGGFLRGQFIVSMTLAFYYSISLSIAGLDLSIILGIAAGALNPIPYIGIISVMSVSLLIALLGGGLKLLLIVLACFLIGMFLESTYISPRFLGKEVGLSPLTLIVALLIGGELFGMIGVFISVPSAAVFKVLLEATARPISTTD